jgi:hypothetical protein
MKKLNKTWFLAGLLAVVVLLVGVLALVYINRPDIFSFGNQKEAVSVTSPDNYQIPMEVINNGETAAETTDPTADWLEYSIPSSSQSSSATSSDSFLFAFRYPDSLKIRQDKNYVTLENTTGTLVQINVNYKESKKSLETFLKETDVLNETSWEGQPAVKITTSTDKVAVAGLPGIFREQELLAAGLHQYIVYFKTSSTIYSISLNTPQADQNLFALFAIFVNNFKLGK